MEIIPGVGVDTVRIGDSRGAVERRLGPAVSPTGGRRAVYGALVVTYDSGGAVELVEAGYGGDEVWLDGVQLTNRFMDDVVAELAAKGHVAHRSDIGFDFEAGFAVFSMTSLSAVDIDPTASDNDPRRVVEGVSVAPYAYFADKPPLDGTVEALEKWLRQRGVI